MVLDCGGGTVDVTVSELEAADPPKLREVLPPSGGSWGGTAVDAEFRKFVNELMWPAGEEGHEASVVDVSATSMVLDAWEAAKVRARRRVACSVVGPSSKARLFIPPPTSFLLNTPLSRAVRL
jgi:hypothetical protein